MKSPQRFTGRAGSQFPGRIRRALDGAIDTDRRNGDTLEVKGGRLEVKLAKGSALKMTNKGLEVDPSMLGDKNREEMRHIASIVDPTVATANDVADKLNEILAELRRTKRLKGMAGP